MSATLALFCAETANTGELGVDWSVLGIVLLGVAILMFAIRAIGLMAAKSLPEPGAKSGSKKASAVAVGGTESGDEITAELLAVLAAAATAVLGSPVRILEISTGKMAAQRNWALEGRREIYLSHRIR